MTAIDILGAVVLILLLITVIQKAWQQASESDKNEFVHDALRKASEQGEAEWRSWQKHA